MWLIYLVYYKCFSAETLVCRTHDYQGHGGYTQNFTHGNQCMVIAGQGGISGCFPIGII